MRCTRCDRPAVPQAVAITPAGVLVFGWCLACLETTGCEQVVIARPSRRPSTRLAIGRPAPWSFLPFGWHNPGGSRPDPLDERRKLAATVALVLTLWGLFVASVELVLWAMSSGPRGNPFANGTPALLIGGAVTAAVGIGLGFLNCGHPLLRPRLTLRVIQGLAFLAALGALLTGVVHRNPRRNLTVVAIASASLAVSAAARWIEVRRSRALAP